MSLRHLLQLASVILMTLVLAASSIQAGPTTPPTPMQFKPTLVISTFSPPDQNVSVTADNGATASYSAKVTATKPPGLTMTVTLVASCAAGFPAAVTPNSIVFTQPGTVSITINVVVPARSQMITGTRVEVDATATYIGGSAYAVSSGSLGVKQYYDIAATASVVKGSGNPQKFQITVQNKGNGNDTFSLDIVDRSSLEKDGFRFDFSKTMLNDITPDENVTVNLEVSYGVATPTGKREVKVKVSSLNSTKSGGNAVSIEAPVSVNVGALGGGGSQTYMIVGLIIMVIFIVILLFVMYKKNKLGKAFKGRTIKIPQGTKGTTKNEGKKAPSEEKKAEKKDEEKEEDKEEDDGDE